jgi:hypothetical protein
MKLNLNSKMMMTMFFVLTASVSHAADGPGGTSGGNGLAGQMVENYLVKDPYTELDGFKVEMEPFIAQMTVLLPDFGNLLNKTVQQQNWYLIPVTLKTLPESITHLHFDTDQYAYQDGTEIFIDQDSWKNKLNDQGRATLYQHETLMAALGIDALTTRDLVAFFEKNPNATAYDVQAEIYNQMKLSNHKKPKLFLSAVEKDLIKRYRKSMLSLIDQLCKHYVEEGLGEEGNFVEFDLEDVSRLNSKYTSELSALRSQANNDDIVDIFIDLMKFGQFSTGSYSVDFQGGPQTYPSYKCDQ